MLIGSWLDWAVIAIITLSTLIGLIRGFVKEALSLAIWAAAFILATRYRSEVASFFENVSPEILRIGLGFLLVFFAVLIIGGIISYGINHMLRLSGFGWLDRLLGVFFGLLRGSLMVAVAVIMIKATPLVATTVWKDSVLVPKFQKAAEWLENYLPADWKQQIEEHTAKPIPASTPTLPSGTKTSQGWDLKKVAEALLNS